MSAEHAAAYVGVSATLLREMAAKGEAPEPVKVRSRTLWRRADLDAWVASLPSGEERAQDEDRAACERAFG
jgi:excisionase family DNA binding protein